MVFLVKTAFLWFHFNGSKNGFFIAKHGILRFHFNGSKRRFFYWQNQKFVRFNSKRQIAFLLDKTRFLWNQSSIFYLTCFVNKKTCFWNFLVKQNLLFTWQKKVEKKPWLNDAAMLNSRAQNFSPWQIAVFVILCQSGQNEFFSIDKLSNLCFCVYWKKSLDKVKKPCYNLARA